MFEFCEKADGKKPKKPHTELYHSDDNNTYDRFSFAPLWRDAHPLTPVSPSVLAGFVSACSVEPLMATSSFAFWPFASCRVHGISGLILKKCSQYQTRPETGLHAILFLRYVLTFHPCLLLIWYLQHTGQFSIRFHGFSAYVLINYALRFSRRFLSSTSNSQVQQTGSKEVVCH